MWITRGQLEPSHATGTRIRECQLSEGWAGPAFGLQNTGKVFWVGKRKSKAGRISTLMNLKGDS